MTTAEPHTIDIDAEEAAWEEIESACQPTASKFDVDVDPDAAAKNRRYGHNGLRRALFCTRNHVPEGDRESTPLTRALTRECRDWRWSSTGILEQSIETHARYATVGFSPAERVKAIACLTSAIGAAKARQRSDVPKP